MRLNNAVVYNPQRVARTILHLAHFPRREVVAGTAGRPLLWQHKQAPRYQVTWS